MNTEVAAVRAPKRKAAVAESKGRSGAGADIDSHPSAPSPAFPSPQADGGSAIEPLSNAAGDTPAAGFEQEPQPPFGFVDPNFDQTGGRDVTMLFADVVAAAHARDQRFVVVPQLAQHI